MVILGKAKRAGAPGGRLAFASVLLLVACAIQGPLVGQSRAVADIPVRYILETKQSKTCVVAISPDGQALAYASMGGLPTLFSEGGVHLADLANGKERASRFPCGFSYCNFVSISFSPNGKTIALAGSVSTSNTEMAVWLFDVATCKQKFVLDGGRKSVDSIAFAPDGKTLASGGDSEEVLLWNVESGKVRARLPGHGQGAIDVVFSPDGKVLASSIRGDGTIFFWDARTGKKQATCKPKRFAEHSWYIAFCPDGKTLAAGGQGSGAVLFLNARTGEITATARDRGNLSVYQLVFSPDGKMLVSTDRESIYLWEVASARVRAKLRGKNAVFSFALSPDGQTLASSNRDGYLQVWDLDRVERKPPDKAEMPRLWSALEGDDAGLAYRAIRTLTTFPNESLPFLRKHLQPAAFPPKPRTRNIACWLEELDSASFAIRENATDELKNCGVSAESMLRQALTRRPSLEVRRRVEAILEHLKQVQTGEQLQQLRAVEVLEHIGTPEARAFLEELAKGVPEARLTQEAKASLARLKKRPVAKR